jgi:hypothetical protein
VPTTGRILFVQSDSTGTRQIQSSKALLEPLASVRADRGRPYRRQEYLGPRLGRLAQDRLDPVVRDFFAAEIAATLQPPPDRRGPSRGGGRSLTGRARPRS